MDFTFEVNLNKQTEKAMKEMPNDVLYNVAKITLDLTYPIIPKDTKKMALETVANGVRKEDEGWYLESSPEYASHVWVMNDDTTNWTTEGTHSQWFARTLQESGETIIQTAIDQAWKENMA